MSFDGSIGSQGRAGGDAARGDIMNEMPVVRARPRMSARAVREVAAAVELGALVLTLLASTLVIEKWYADTVSALVMSGALWIGGYFVLTYRFTEAAESVVGRDLLAGRLGNWLKAALLVVIFAFSTKTSQDLSRLWFAASAGLGLVAIAVARTAVWMAFSSSRREGAGTRIGVYGVGGDLADVELRLRANALGTFVGVFDDAAQDASAAPGEGLSRLVERARQGEVDAVVINLPWHQEERIRHIVRQLETVNVDVLLLPPAALAEHGVMRLARVGQLNALALYTRPADGVAALIKTCMDRLVALAALVLLSPLLAAVALAIRLESPGPILFRQYRCGLNNQPFTMWKFRSMYAEATDRNADRLVTRNDNRITKVGAIIRKLSIDELPQLFNVLNGSMSLVGPRPHAYGAKAADRLYEDVVDRYAARHRMKPGLTGLAQVRGFRGNTLHETDIRNRVESDLEYMERWSLSLDLSILMRTAFVLFWQRNAY